jgi:hypothetical protein
MERDRSEREDVNTLTVLLFKPKLSSMQVHSATCSYSVELYKQWYTLADFLPNWNFCGFFFYISLITP